MTHDSRQRMIVSTAGLVGSHGASGTSFSDIMRESRAPRGSIYHYFPDGKRQLLGAAIQWTSEQILSYQQQCPATTPTGVVEHFVSLFRHSVVSSDCRAGCPVAGVVVDTYSTDDELQRRSRASFRAWEGLLARQLVAVGVERAAARSLALTTLAAVEGALILCRTESSVAPLDAVAAELRRLVRSGRSAAAPRRGASRPKLSPRERGFKGRARQRRARTADR